MKYLSHFLALLVFVVTLVSAEQKDLVGVPCMAAAATYQYGCPPGFGGYTNYACLCQNAAYIGTSTYCITQYASTDPLQALGLGTINENCQEVTGKVFSQRDFQILNINATRFISSMNTSPDPNVNQTLPFQIPEKLIDNYLTATEIDSKFKTNSRYYGAALLGYFALILLLRMISNLAYTRCPSLLRTFDNKLSRKIRRHILLPGTFNQKHRVSHKFLGMEFNVPSRAETFTILGYQVLHIIVLCVDYDIYRPNYIYFTKQIHIAEYIGIRAGVLAASQLPLVFLFGARNNFFIYPTGWQYDVFNMYHRWITRGLMIDVFIHAIAFSLVASGYHDYAGSWDKTYWRWGVVAGCAGGLILVQSLSPIRHACYQAFLYLHIPLAIVFIVGAWWHLDTIGQMQYIYASVAIWIYDRVMRWVRVLWAGGLMSGSAKLHPGDVMELTIDYSQRYKWRPGYFGYLHIVRWNKVWQSRPFTILAGTDPDEYGKLKIFAKACGMMTKSNWNYFKRHPHLSTKIKLMLESPYGVGYPLHNYDSVVLIAGGIGITATYGYALEIRNRSDRRIKVTFIWVISDDSSLQWFSQQLAYINADDRIDVQIFVNNAPDLTRTLGEKTDTDYALQGESRATDNKYYQSNHPINMSTSDAASSTSLSNPLHLNTIYSRPNLRWLVFQQIMKSSGTLAFMTCGPSAMSDDIRVAIAENIESANARVDYFEEAFSF